MDETTTHMHFAFVPVVTDKKRNGFKVSAKEAINRHDLQTFHTDLESYMSLKFGREVGIINEATKNGNRSIQELKLQSYQHNLREIENQISNNVKLATQQAVERTQKESEINNLTKIERALNERIEALQNERENINDEINELSKIKANIFENYYAIDAVGKKAIGGNIVNKDDLEALKTQAKGYLGQSRELERVREENKILIKENNLNVAYIDKLINDNKTLRELIDKLNQHKDSRVSIISVIKSNPELTDLYFKQKSIFQAEQEKQRILKEQELRKKEEVTKSHHRGLSR
jgi:hypothetical protein